MRATLAILQDSSSLGQLSNSSFKQFLETPAPDGKHLLFVVVLLLCLWLLLRQDNKKRVDFKGNARDVLEERFKKGEISEEAYRRAHSDLAQRPK